MNLSDILVRPIVTEKSTGQLTSADSYAFEVGLGANKIQIKSAVETFFGVNVADVQTMIVRGKYKRSGRHYGKRSNWKKAYVRLEAGHSLNVIDV